MGASGRRGGGLERARCLGEGWGSLGLPPHGGQSHNAASQDSETQSWDRPPTRSQVRRVTQGLP